MSGGAEVAGCLWSIGAFGLALEEPRQFQSGILSPIYTDCRLLVGHPDQRRRVVRRLVVAVEELSADVSLIAGTATAGIPHASWVSEAMDLPMAYVRSEAKAHGKQNLVEGDVQAGQVAVVVEDLISTGGSSIRTVDGLRTMDVRVEGIVSIFDYQLEDSAKNFEAAGIHHRTLSTVADAINAGLAGGHFGHDTADRLWEWQRDPWGWTEAHGGSRPQN